jgi:hypothetical protein
MKTPPKNFRVEFKNGRRRSAMPAPSIWGSVDIKSLVREAEATHHLVRTETVDHAGDARATPRGLALTMAPAVSTMDDPDPQSEAALPAATVSDPLKDISSLVAFSQPDPGLAPRHPARKPKKPRTSAAEVRIIGPVLVPYLQAAVAVISIGRDELAALEAENRRLKRLLARQLQQENERLGDMLSRFGVA